MYVCHSRYCHWDCKLTWSFSVFSSIDCASGIDTLHCKHIFSGVGSYVMHIDSLQPSQCTLTL